MKNIKEYFKYSFDFVGVVDRKTFWLDMLFVVLLNALFGVVGYFFNVVLIIWMAIFLILIVPTTSLIVRRLHDTDRSGFNALWLLFPFAGCVVVFIYCLEKTKYFVN